MGLRLSTAMTLVMTLGLVAACGEDEAEVEVEESDAEVVVEEPAADVAVVEEADEGIADGDVSTEEEVVVVEEEEPADDNVIAEVDGGEPVEVETNVESDGEPITAEVGGDAEAEAPEEDVAVAEEDEAVLADPAEEVADVTGEADATEGDAEVVIVDEAAEGETELAAADTGTAAEVEQVPADGAEAEDDGLVTLETNVTVVDSDEEGADAPTEQDVAQATGEGNAADEGTLDAEARVEPGASEDAQVEEINDVATDGIDSASEADMLDLDNLVLDDAGVQSLTEYVEGSEDISDTQKVTIVAGIDAARDNPERLEELLEQVRELTGQ